MEIRCIFLEGIVSLSIILVYGSERFVFLERELNDVNNPNEFTYQKRNYNVKTPLLLNSYYPYGFTLENGELQYIVAVDRSDNTLYVLTMGIKSITR